MPERIDARPALTLIGAALLLVALFLDWYVVPAVPPATVDTPVGNAWAVFESLDIVLAGVAIVAIYVAYEGITGRGRIGEGWLLPLGLLAVVIVGSQLLDAPPSVGATTDPATGIWMALGGAGAMLVGGILSTARVSLALELDSSSRGGAATTRRRATAQDA
ncbi:MAG: hypothetical protein ACRDL6_11730 [Solirubrobacterales bacterium]